MSARTVLAILVILAAGSAAAAGAWWFRGSGESAAAPAVDCAQPGAQLYTEARYPDAIHELRRAIEKGCPAGSAYAYLGWSLMAIGDRDGALAALREAATRDPSLKVKEDIEAMEEEAEEESGEEEGD
jgi:cytochrome c-type biogenesis protein CcmH/NrfG